MPVLATDMFGVIDEPYLSHSLELLTPVSRSQNNAKYRTSGISGSGKLSSGELKTQHLASLVSSRYSAYRFIIRYRKTGKKQCTIMDNNKR